MAGYTGQGGASTTPFASQYGPYQSGPNLNGTVQQLQQQEYNNIGNLGNGQITTVNPATTAAQMAALGQYGTLAQSSNLDPQALAEAQQYYQQAGQQEQGQQGGIGASAFGTGNVYGGGGGQAFAQRLGAQQNTATPGALAASQVAAGARNRTLSALGNYAGLAGNIGQQQFGQAQQGFGNALNLANAKNNVITGEQNILTNAGNQQNAQTQGYLNTGLGVVGKLFGGV